MQLDGILLYLFILGCSTTFVLTKQTRLCTYFRFKRQKSESLSNKLHFLCMVEQKLCCRLTAKLKRRMWFSLSGTGLPDGVFSTQICIQIWVNFGGPWGKNVVSLMAHRNILWPFLGPFGNFMLSWYIIFTFWYIASIKIRQPRSGRWFEMPRAG
jgi:hypothetical protein